MTEPLAMSFRETDIDMIAGFEGRVAVVVTPDGKMDVGARRANKLTRGAVKRLVESKAWDKAKTGDVKSLAWPAGMAAEALDVLCLPRGADARDTRASGASLGSRKGDSPMLVLAGQVRRPVELSLGIVLRSYAFRAHKTEDREEAGDLTMMVADPGEAEARAAAARAVAEGVFFTRDLVNEPANHLTTTEFADRLTELESLGLKVTVLDEDALRQLGMNLLLLVGHGRRLPFWNGPAARRRRRRWLWWARAWCLIPGVSA